MCCLWYKLFHDALLCRQIWGLGVLCVGCCRGNLFTVWKDATIGNIQMSACLELPGALSMCTAGVHLASSSILSFVHALKSSVGKSMSKLLG